MPDYKGYRCSVCGAEYEPDELPYTCPLDGGNLDILLDYEELRRHYRPEDITSRADFSLWRYLPLLPVEDPDADGTPLGGVGWTPAYTPSELAHELRLRHVWVKDEGRNPTASFKDRASAVVVASAMQMGLDVVVTASTGNAGAALAGMCAAVGHKAVVFAPRTAPPAKVAQLLIYGAQVILVDGNYDAAFDLSVQAANEFGWYCRNTGYNPFTLEGKKTAAFEIWERLILPFGGTRPFCIFVSVGDGNIISGIHKGFKDLQQLGWLEHMPRLFGIQSDQSAAVANAYFRGSETIEPVKATTLADSISVDLPRDGLRAVRAATQTGGAYLTVSDNDIIRAIADLGRVGIFAEPAGSAAYAGLKHAVSAGLVGAEDPVVVINTGNGLKDVRSAMQAAGEAPVIEPTMQALRKHLKM